MHKLKVWKCFSVWMVLVLVAALGVALVPASPVQAQTTWYVDDDNCPGPGTGTQADPFCKIQDAVDAASAGDTINVAVGNYDGAVVDKGVTISGAPGGASVITSGVQYKVGGPPYTTAFRLDGGADGTEISNFTVNNNQGANFYFAVFARGADDVAVDSLIVNDTVQGITNWGGSGWAITNNTVTDTVAAGGGGIGIFLGAVPPDYRTCSNNLVQYNTINAAATAEAYSCPGICLCLDLRYGAYEKLDDTEDVSGNQILNNNITASGANNGVGVEVGTIIGNSEDDPDRTDPTKIAAIMADAAVHDNTVQQNTVDGTDMGVYFYNVTDLTVTLNTVENSVGDGIFAEHGQSGTVVTSNYLTNNNVQVTDNTTDTETLDPLDIESILNNNSFDRAVTVDHSGASLLHTIWSKIQDGIDAAVGGDTINVAAGTYVEAIMINKPLTLRGATYNVNKNGYTVPAGYAWDETVESIVNHPNPTSTYNAIVDIVDTDDVTFEGFVVQELNAVGNNNTSLVRVYAHTTEISNIVVRNNVIGPNTNTTSQDGTKGRMGLYIVNHPYSDQYGVVNSTFSGNKIFDCKGNGNNVFIWSSYKEYGAPGPASMAGTVIEDNEIYGAHRSGIETAGGFSGLTIQNSKIYGNGGPIIVGKPALMFGNGILMIRGSGDRANIEGYGPVNVTIEGNEIYDNDGHGIYMGPNNAGITITRNSLYNNGEDAIMVDLIGNYWNPDFESDAGPYTNLGGSQNIAAHLNGIYDSVGYGVQVIGTPTNGFVLNAINNWWGANDGPSGVGSGSGDAVSANVDYDPWLVRENDTPSAAGTGPVTFGVGDGWITGLTGVAEGALPAVGKPTGVTFPHGLFSFNIIGITPSSCVTVTIIFPSPVPVGAQYWKFQNGSWIDCTSLLGDDDGDNVLMLTLCDGGLGDADGIANGTIVDPGGPAVAAPAAPSVPAAPAGSGVSPTMPRPLNPPKISLQYLSITPQQTSAGQPVTITTNVVNTGDEAGNLSVALKINGQVEQTRMVSVGPQGTQPVKFTVTKAQPGTYTVDIAGQKGSFTVLGAGSGSGSHQNGGLIALIVMALLILATAVVLTMTFRRPA
jgi:parallel beta-helix repeat protein